MDSPPIIKEERLVKQVKNIIILLMKINTHYFGS